MRPPSLSLCDVRRLGSTSSAPSARCVRTLLLPTNLESKAVSIWGQVSCGLVQGAPSDDCGIASSCSRFVVSKSRLPGKRHARAGQLGTLESR